VPSHFDRSHFGVSLLLFSATLLFTLCSTDASAASSAAVPTAENAYCGKGNVPGFGEKDGPAQLPTACYYTGLDGTPSPGKTIKVAAGSDLGSALDGAQCGDTLFLAAGASFEVKAFPAKKCNDQRYITVRTDTPDAKLPPEGRRISPAWAGVTSLPGRPAFAQPAGGAAKLLATVLVHAPGGADMGDHYRFIGIEWTSEPGARGNRMISTEGADHVIFDRNWFHPAAGVEFGDAVRMVHGTHHIAVINSYLSGFNCIARSGSCTDSSALSGGNGDANEPIGTLKLYNNFIEASGENILFGGAKSEVNPTDVEIRRNHLFKPLLWKEGEAGYAPADGKNPVIVKNNFELKSGIRVLFEANLIENCWGGFSQTGFAVLITPKNQNSLCPKCEITDITIRYNRIRNVAGVLQIANGTSSTGGVTLDGGRYSIHDLIADSIHSQDWKGLGQFAIVVSREPLLHDVSLDHITAFVSGALFDVGNRFEVNNEKIPTFSVTNNLLMAGKDSRRAEFSSVSGGAANCAYKAQWSGPQAVLDACFVGYKFDKNLIIGEKGGWPKGTIVVSNAKAAGLRDFESGSNGVSGTAKDARLCHAGTPGCGQPSPGAGAATDGKDIGADVDAINAALDGVE
jgi:hypothetical protein